MKHSREIQSLTLPLSSAAQSMATAALGLTIPLDSTSSAVTGSYPYATWLKDWTTHLATAPTSIRVPSMATAITTPLKPWAWRQLLATHPNRLLVDFFITGLLEGFRLGFTGPGSSLRSATRNLGGALDHPKVVDDYLAAEISIGRVAGPFEVTSIPLAHISRFGVIPKRHTSNKWRLIVDLSHPAGHSINDGIPKQLCSLSYITIDTAIDHILRFGPGTFLAKMDVKNAFRLLPVHPADRHLLAMKWGNKIFIDTCLPFGLRSAPKLFNLLADLLSWVLELSGASPTIHYLDDFLTFGPPNTTTCQDNLAIMEKICEELGIPLALDKLEGPSHSLTFLGVRLDTQLMQARLPDDKLHRIKQDLSKWLHKKKATKRQILSLVGVLQHASKVVRPGRTFVSRMYSTAARLKKLSYFTRLNRHFRSDLYWWHIFITNWNGISILRSSSCRSPPDFRIYTDASGSWGCGAVFSCYWFQHAWTSEWSSSNIMAKELVPIVFSCAVWGPLLSHKSADFQCDNQSLVVAINKGSAKDVLVMQLLRCLWFFTAFFDINISATHIPGASNTAADLLSRNQAVQCLKANPQLQTMATHLPIPLLNLVSPGKWDWTSPSFINRFKQTCASVQQQTPTRL